MFIFYAEGGSFTLVLSASGKVYSCGYNEDRQCGVAAQGDSIKKLVEVVDDIKDISCGESHSLCLKNDGGLFVFGLNTYQQLGFVTPDRSICVENEFFKSEGIRLQQIEAGGWHNIVMDDEGICWGFGWSEYAQLGEMGKAYIGPKKLEVTVKEKVERICCGPWHSVLLMKDNEVWTCGYNGHNECSIAISKDTVSPLYHLKRKEIGVDDDCRIAGVVTGYQSTLIVVEE